MASKVMYCSPRDIPGSFLVGIVLDLLPREKASVTREDIPDEHYNHREQKPVEVITDLPGGKRRHIYILSRCHEREYIWITIEDSEVVYLQRVVYMPNATSIKEHYSSERAEKVQFHPIELINIGKVSPTFGRDEMKKLLLE